MPHHHFMLHKPYGYLSQFVGESNKKKRLGELYPFPAGTMAVGRLDEDSEGLLLLTTDGKISTYFTSSKMEKEYFAQVDGQITPEAVGQLQQSVEIGIRNEKYQTKPCTAYPLTSIPELSARTRKIRDDRHGPTSWVAITLTEGKNRQIRKMTATVGFPTLRLIRVRIGDFHLGQLPAGQVLDITEQVEAMRQTHPPESYIA